MPSKMDKERIAAKHASCWQCANVLAPLWETVERRAMEDDGTDPEMMAATFLGAFHASGHTHQVFRLSYKINK